MKTATIYSNGSQECERMAALLKNLGGEFLEYKLDKHFTQKAFEQEFGQEATYPQVSIGYNHIGSMKEALQYLKQMGMFERKTKMQSMMASHSKTSGIVDSISLSNQ